MCGVRLQPDRRQTLCGAGKSTAIALMLGLQQPDAGVARLFGQPPQLVEARRRIGVMMQEAALVPELRVREQIALVSSYYPSPLTPEETLRFTHTEPLAEWLCGRLSGGQKRQVQFALAVCGRPSLLFLDEPTTGLDIEARGAMWAGVRQLVSTGCSVVLTMHYLEEAEAIRRAFTSPCSRASRLSASCWPYGASHASASRSAASADHHQHESGGHGRSGGGGGNGDTFRLLPMHLDWSDIQHFFGRRV